MDFETTRKALKPETFLTGNLVNSSMTNHTVLLLAQYNHPTLIALVNNWMSTHPKEVNPVHSARSLDKVHKICLLSGIALVVGVASVIAASMNPNLPIALMILSMVMLLVGIAGFVGMVVTVVIIKSKFKAYREFLDAITYLESLKDVGVITANLVREETNGSPDAYSVRLTNSWENEVGVREGYHSTPIQKAIEFAFREKGREVKALQMVSWRKAEALKLREELEFDALRANHVLKMPADAAYYIKDIAWRQLAPVAK